MTITPEKASKVALALVVIGLLLAGYTKFVWQSGFDQGADVTLCVIDSIIEHDGQRLSTGDPACERAMRYENNPLWIFRRRDGGPA